MGQKNRTLFLLPSTYVTCDLAPAPDRRQHRDQCGRAEVPALWLAGRCAAPSSGWRSSWRTAGLRESLLIGSVQLRLRTCTCSASYHSYGSHMTRTLAKGSSSPTSVFLGAAAADLLARGDAADLLATAVWEVPVSRATRNGLRVGCTLDEWHDSMIVKKHFSYRNADAAQGLRLCCEQGF